MPLRPEQVAPDTGKHIDRSQIDAEVAHESTLHDFAIEETDLGWLDQEQIGIMALVDAGEKLGLHLPATQTFFKQIHDRSTAFEGRGRAQAKECITAGSIPMSLLFPMQEKKGIIETIKGFWPGKKADTPQQKVT